MRAWCRPAFWAIDSSSTWMNFSPRSAEAIAAITLMTTAKARMSTRASLNEGPMSWGKKARPVRAAAWAGSEVAEHRRAEQALQRVEAQEGGEDVAERRQVGELGGIGDGDAVGDEAVVHRRGHLVVQPEDEQREEEPHRERHAGLGEGHPHPRGRPAVASGDRVHDRGRVRRGEQAHRRSPRRTSPRRRASRRSWPGRSSSPRTSRPKASIPAVAKGRAP